MPNIIIHGLKSNKLLTAGFGFLPVLRVYADTFRLDFSRDDVQVGFGRDKVRLDYDRDTLALDYNRDTMKIDYDRDGVHTPKG